MNWYLMLYAVMWLLSSMIFAIAVDDEFENRLCQGLVCMLFALIWPLIWLMWLVMLPAAYIRHWKKEGEDEDTGN